MGAVVASINWADSPLGPMEAWPESLKTTVALALSSNFPISLAWGSERIQIYNDGYWPICGEKHPYAMGQDFRECWYSAWPVIGDAFDQATAGEAAFLVNQRMFLDRNGYLEETFFTFSFSPIRDASGKVAGLFHPVTELTAQSLAERRLRILQDISRRAGSARSLDAALHELLAAIEPHQFDLPFAALYVPDGTDHVELLGGSNLGSSIAAIPKRLNLSDDAAAAWGIAPAMREGTIQQRTEFDKRVVKLGEGAYPEACHTAMVLPILAPGSERPLALLVAGVSPRRELDATYESFYRMLQQTIANELNNAVSYEAEIRRSDELAQLDRAKTVFFSNISHEFRTPLTLMLGPLEESLAAATMDEGMREQLCISYRNALRLLKLVNSLLDFSRLEAGRSEARFQATDIDNLTADLASNFRSACESAGLELVVECASEEEIYIDRGMWEKIVLNLISNAFKFTFEGSIHVSMKSTPEGVELTVRDTGIGIEAVEIPRLSERFHRIEHSRGRTQEGTGIGLSMVFELVRLHGGTVDVDSEVGRGSTFRILLQRGRQHLDPRHIEDGDSEPMLEGDARAYVEEAMTWLSPDDSTGRDLSPGGVEAAVEAPAQAGGRSAARVLVIDDNSDMRSYIARGLGSVFNIQTANDGQAGLESALRSPPDIIITDVMMPHMDGFELIDKLRSDERTRTIPILVLSARAGDEARIEGIDAGADDYLVKPFNMRELLARVRGQLELAQVRRDNERRLRTADKQKNEFLATLGHELRNPLAALSNALQLLEIDSSEETEQHCRKIFERQTAVLARIVDDLLDLPRITYDKLQLNFEVLDLGEILKISTDEVAQQARTLGHTLEIDIPADVGFVRGDPIRLSQAFINLLTNAVKYTPPGGQIRVSAENCDGMLVIRVIDNGVGIEAESQAAIFEMFTQVHSDRTDVSSGFGIGLALVQKLVERHDGTVTVKSGGAGQGSEFIVCLPAAVPEPCEVGEAVSGVSSAASLKILVVDDNRDACFGLKLILDQWGHLTRLAYRGREAIAAAEKFEPQIILLDIAMPDMNGFQVASELRAKPWAADTTIIAITGFGMAHDIENSLSSGFDRHLTKPLDLQQLREILDATVTA